MPWAASGASTSGSTGAKNSPVAYDAMVQLPFLSPAHGSIPQIELATKISELLDWGAPAHAYFTGVRLGGERGCV